MKLYENYIRDLAVMFGADSGQATTDAKEMVDFEIQLANVSGIPILTKLHDVLVGFVPLSFETVNCFTCSRRRVAIARYRMICLVLLKFW